MLAEPRTGRNVQHDLVAPLRQPVYSRLAGQAGTNDAERLAQDPAMWMITSRQGLETPAAGTNNLGRFEIEVLTREENLEGPMCLNGQSVQRAMPRTPRQRVILDRSESPVHGAAGRYGHFEYVCYHPQFCFNRFGDGQGTLLRQRPSPEATPARSN